MAKYICKNNPAHTFTEPTADFWCPLCEKNTGMLELLDEETTPIEDDGKIDALEEEIESLKKKFSKLYDSSNEKSTDKFSNQSENEGNEFNTQRNEPKNIFKEFLNSWQILFRILAVLIFVLGVIIFLDTLRIILWF